MHRSLTDRTRSGDLPLPQPQLEAEAETSLILRMDNLLVGTLSLPKLPWREQLAICDVQRYLTPLENVSGSSHSPFRKSRSN